MLYEQYMQENNAYCNRNGGCVGGHRIIEFFEYLNKDSYLPCKAMATNPSQSP